MSPYARVYPALTYMVYKPALSQAELATGMFYVWTCSNALKANPGKNGERMRIQVHLFIDSR
jgi:hypothetical protein